MVVQRSELLSTLSNIEDARAERFGQSKMQQRRSTLPGQTQEEVQRKPGRESFLHLLARLIHSGAEAQSASGVAVAAARPREALGVKEEECDDSWWWEGGCSTGVVDEEAIPGSEMGNDER